MKTSSIKVKDARGQAVTGWSVLRIKNAVCVGHRRARMASGWALCEPDGYERFCEGNWEVFVAYAQSVFSNYGLTAQIS